MTSKPQLLNLASAFGISTDAEPLLRTTRPVKLGDQVRVAAKPQRRACRVERIEIVNSAPNHWIVRDIQLGTVGNILATPLPGGEFGPTRDIRFESLIVQLAQDFALLISYIGPNPDGEVFGARLFGAIAKSREDQAP